MAHIISTSEHRYIYFDQTIFSIIILKKNKLNNLSSHIQMIVRLGEAS